MSESVTTPTADSVGAGAHRRPGLAVAVERHHDSGTCRAAGRLCVEPAQPAFRADEEARGTHVVGTPCDELRREPLRHLGANLHGRRRKGEKARRGCVGARDLAVRPAPRLAITACAIASACARRPTTQQSAPLRSSPAKSGAERRSAIKQGGGSCRSDRDVQCPERSVGCDSDMT